MGKPRLVVKAVRSRHRLPAAREGELTQVAVRGGRGAEVGGESLASSAHRFPSGQCFAFSHMHSHSHRHTNAHVKQLESNQGTEEATTRPRRERSTNALNFHPLSQLQIKEGGTLYLFVVVDFFSLPKNKVKNNLMGPRIFRISRSPQIAPPPMPCIPVAPHD